MKGWVYIITNKAMPNLVKVGYSTKDPEMRANELYSTGVPYRYIVEYDALVNGPYEVEQKSHKLLKNYNENKEWFRCDVIKAVAAIREAAGNAIIHESINFTFDIVDKLDLKLTCETETIAEIIHTADIFEKNETVSFTSGKFLVQDGIAFDTETGLTWLRFAHGQQWGKNNVIGEAKQIGWQDAMAIPIKFNQKGYAGYNNWRLPNIDELKKLIDRNKGKKGDYIDADVFSKNPMFLWSSSCFASDGSVAWLVNFYGGYSNGRNKENGNFVRLVRSNESVSFISGKFIVEGGIAFDTETGLTWLRFAHGQQWEKDNIAGEVKKIIWRDAMAIPQTFNQKGYAGYNDWRLPNIDELKTLIDRNKGIKGNYIDADVFPKNPTFLWSSSLNDSGAWLVFFNDGSCYDFFKNWLHGGFVRLVR